MNRRTLFLIGALAVLPALWVLPTPPPSAQTSASRLPPRLTGQEFFTLMTELSEADGFFRSDNLVSNELFMQRVIPELARTVKPGRVYLGVGPEQNFTYMATVKPAMAFIIDVRRGNLQLHLMYKALFELSVDRADFVSRLFSLKRPSRTRARVNSAEHLHRLRRPGPAEPGDLQAELEGDRTVLRQEERAGAVARRPEGHRSESTRRSRRAGWTFTTR